MHQLKPLSKVCSTEMHRREFLEKRKILEKYLAIVWNIFWIAESGGFLLEEFF